MKRIVIAASIGVSVLGMILSLGACTKASDSGSSSTTYAYQGAGSRWSTTFSGGSFTIKKFATATATAAEITVDGTYVDYSTGFRKLTVTSASGSGAPSAGATAYGFEVPGFAFFLKPIGSDSEPIVMVESGVCPSTSFNGNWIIAKTHSGTLGTANDTFGSATFTFNGASSSATIHKRNPVDGGVPTSGTTPDTVTFNSANCSGGVLSFSPGGSETIDMFFTSNGGALVHSFDTGLTHDSIIFAGPTASSAVTQAQIAGTYSVLVFDNSKATEKIFPGKITIPTAGNWTAAEVTDIQNDTVSGTTIAVSSFAAHALASGLFTATVGSTGRISCTYINYNSTKVIACNGYGDATNKKMFFFLGKAR